MKRASLLAALVPGLVVSTLGCGEEDEQALIIHEPNGVVFSLAGIYTVETENLVTQGCDETAEQSVASPAPMVLVDAIQCPTAVVHAIRCHDSADCRAQRAQWTCHDGALAGLSDPSWYLGSAGQRERWSGILLSTNPFGDPRVNGCRVQELRSLLTAPAENLVQIEARVFGPEAYPPDADGYCGATAAAGTALNDALCSERRVVRASLVEGI